MTDITFVLKVVFYRSEAGNEPVREWLKELPRDDKRQISEDVKTAQLGWPLGMSPHQENRDGPVGSEDQIGKWHSPSFLYCGWRIHDLAAWLYQKIAEDSAKRSEDSNYAS